MTEILLQFLFAHYYGMVQVLVDHAQHQPALEPGDKSYRQPCMTVIWHTISTLFVRAQLLERDRMTLEGFLSNNRGINGGENFPEGMMRGLFASITTSEIRMSDEVTICTANHA